jgi:hypothetical protein
MPSSVAPLPALPPRQVRPPALESPQSVQPLARSTSVPGDVRPLPLMATSPTPAPVLPATGQSAVMGVPVRTDSNVNTGAEDAAQQQRRGGRHTKVHVAPGTEPQRTTDRPKRSRRWCWFGLGQTEKDVAALQDWLGGMSETECRQVDSAVRYLQERWRLRAENAPARSGPCVHLPLQRTGRFAQGCSLGLRCEPSPLGSRRATAVARWCPPKRARFHRPFLRLQLARDEACGHADRVYAHDVLAARHREGAQARRRLPSQGSARQALPALVAAQELPQPRRGRGAVHAHGTLVEPVLLPGDARLFLFARAKHGGRRPRRDRAQHVHDPLSRQRGAAPCSTPPPGPGEQPSSAPAPPQGAPGGAGQLGTPRGRGRASGRPATASGTRAIRLKVADVSAFAHPGAAGPLLRWRRGAARHDDGVVPLLAEHPHESPRAAHHHPRHLRRQLHRHGGPPTRAPPPLQPHAPDLQPCTRPAVPCTRPAALCCTRPATPCAQACTPVPPACRRLPRA